MLRGPSGRGAIYATPHLGGGAQGSSSIGGRRMVRPARAGLPQPPGPTEVDLTPPAPPRVPLRGTVRVAAWRAHARLRLHELGLSLDLLLGMSDTSRWFYPDDTENDKEPT